MTDRSVEVHLLLNIADYKRGTNEAARDTDVLTARLKGMDNVVVSVSGDLDKAGGNSRTFASDLVTVQRESRGAGDGLRGLGRDTDVFSRGLGNGSRELDSFSGRLSLAVRLAATLGPALIPIGAGTVPAIAGLTAGLGAAAGALGVTLLATVGLGDGLKALNKYQLEPTAANAVKLQQEFEKLGPSGEAFVRYLDSIGPELKSLQNTARAGFLPGAEDGIDSLLTRLPQLRRIIGELSGEVGDIAADAGADLGGERYSEFFDYLDREAAPILDQVAQAAGNVAETLANLLVGVDPLTDMFLTGLVDKTEDLALWSQNLDDSDGFQRFLQYAQEQGPATVEFLGSLVDLLASVAEAAAPWGSLMLPVLTATSEALATIAGSDAGPVIFTTIAAMSTLSGATRLWGSSGVTAARQFITGQTAAQTAIGQTQGRLAGLGRSGLLLGGLALAATGVTDSFGLGNTAALAMAGSIAGPWGAAVGTGVGLALDFAAANDTVSDALGRAESAIRSGNLAQANADLAAANEELEKFREGVEFDGSETPLSADYWKKTFSPGTLKNTIEGWFGDSDLEELEDRRDAAIKARDELADAFSAGLPFEDGGSGIQYFLTGPLTDATEAADDFTAAMARVNAVLTGRSDWRAYQEAIDAVRKSIKENGKTHDENTEKGRANAAALDDFAAKAVKVSENIGDLDKKANHLDNARDQFIAMATAMGYSERRAERLATRLGLLDKDVTPTVNLETSTAQQREAEIRRRLAKLGLSRADPRVGMLLGDFEQGDARVLAMLRVLTGSKAVPKAFLNDASFQAVVAAVRNTLRSVDGDTATTYVDTVYRVRREFNPQSVAGRAGGGMVYGPGGPKDDLIDARLSNREFVQQASAVDFYGVGAMYALNERRVPKELLAGFASGGYGGHATAPSLVQRFADGGSPVARYLARDRDDDRGIDELDRSARDAAGGLRGLRNQLRETEKRLEKLRDRVDDNVELLGKMRDLRDSVGQAFSPAELTGGGLAGFQLALSANRNDTNAATRYLHQAENRGLSGQLYQLIAGSGDLSLAQSFAGMSRAEIARYERQYRGYLTDQRQLGNQAVAEKFDKTIAGVEQTIKDQRETIRNLTREVRTLGDRVEAGARRGVGDRHRGDGPRRRHNR